MAAVELSSAATTSASSYASYIRLQRLDRQVPRGRGVLRLLTGSLDVSILGLRGPVSGRAGGELLRSGRENAAISRTAGRSRSASPSQPWRRTGSASWPTTAACWRTCPATAAVCSPPPVLRPIAAEPGLRPPVGKDLEANADGSSGAGVVSVIADAEDTRAGRGRSVLCRRRYALA